MKILNVSNRLPVHLEKNGDVWVTKKSVSGLATAVDAVLNKQGGRWLGWIGADYEVFQKNREEIESWKELGYYGIGIPTDILHKAYEGFNNDVIWAVFHNFPNYMNYRSEDFEAYVKMNEIFCEEVIKNIEDEDELIWLHDFQLFLLPKMLRDKGVKNKIAFFLHISFPTSDIFETIPNGRKLIEGVLSSDLIQFHTLSHVKNFERSVRRVGLAIGNCRVEANPIGIDPTLFENALDKPEIQIKAYKIREAFRGRKIILATERLDYTKGIKERIKAFEYLLDKYPELREKVVLVQIAVLSRQGVPIYQTIGEEVDKAVGNLNGKYGTLDWTPIYYTNQGWSQEELAALYSTADVACVTPLIDGMNLVSKEYVISGGNYRSLILSKFAGSANELSEAFIVNPYDTEEVGEAMYKALHIPNVRKLKAKVYENTAFNWAERVINAV